MRGRFAGFAIAMTALGLAMSTIDAAAQDGKALVGTWEWVAVDNTAADGTRTQPFGPKPGGYLTFGADGQFFWLITRPGRAKFASGRRAVGCVVSALIQGPKLTA
jgi:Lipocalin-like domain